MIRLFQASDPSRATTSPIIIPCPDGLEFAGYQKACVDYASRRKDTLIGDAPGVGKTIEAIGCINFSDNAKKILVICPGFLKGNWRDEFLKWDTKSLSVGVMKGMKGELPETDVVIVNYDILKPYRDRLRRIQWDYIIVDEAHKLKNKKADRTREVFGGIKRNQEGKIVDRVTPISADHRLLLTGTPSLNGKPKELWNLIQQLDPTGLGADWFYYARRYCQLQELKFGGKRVGWKWDGCDNLPELQQIMRERFMIRRLKEEVLKDLPPKRRMVIPIESGVRLRKELDKELREFEEWARDREDAYLTMPNFGDFSKKMLETGLSMVKSTVELVENDLDSYPKIVVMCFHKIVAIEIEAGLNGTSGKKIREMVGDSTQQNEVLLDMSVRVRTEKISPSRVSAGESEQPMSELWEHQTRAEPNANLSPSNYDTIQMQEKSSEVFSKDGRRNSSEDVSSIGHTLENEYTQMAPQSPVDRQNQSKKGVYQKQHMGDKLSSERFEKRCNFGGNSIDSKKSYREGSIIRIDGDMPVEDRIEAVKRFQTDLTCRVLIGTMGSCGEGLTMTASSCMIFPERSWVPGQVTQAEDRIHRRGQKDSVIYKHLVREGSLAERQVKALIVKQDLADTMLDRRN